MSKPIVAIVGRPNVGKSTLFNIFADSRISIVEDTPGVTRDRLYAEAEWLDRRFMMVDTGGIEIANTDSIAVSIREQAKIAIKEADVILFVCDARTGVTTEDQEVAKLIRMAQKPVVLAVNKADTPTQELEAYEFYNLGIGEPYMISASNRLNLGDLLDATFLMRMNPMMMIMMTSSRLQSLDDRMWANPPSSMTSLGRPAPSSAMWQGQPVMPLTFLS